MNRACIVVSGLPGSGKSTLGKAVAVELGARLFDKDDYLEQLFEVRGIGDREWRQKLSRESDLMFQADAVTEDFAVLVSHWRALGGTSSSGTPTEWLRQAFVTIVELRCLCPPALAAQRFVERKRHPGHHDETRSYEEVLKWMTGYESELPLGVGTLEEVDTSGEVTLPALTANLRQMVGITF